MFNLSGLFRYSCPLVVYPVYLFYPLVVYPVYQVYPLVVYPVYPVYPDKFIRMNVYPNIVYPDESLST